MAVGLGSAPKTWLSSAHALPAPGAEMRQNLFWVPAGWLPAPRAQNPISRAQNLTQSPESNAQHPLVMLLCWMPGLHCLWSLQ